MSSLFSSNLTHSEIEGSFEKAYEKIYQKICDRGDLSYISVSKQIELLTQLGSFPLGKFLIERGGLNGYWTHYVVTHPESNRSHIEGFEKELLENAPWVLATQQRFVIFKETIQKKLKENIKLASIPSGIMGEFLDLDFSRLNHFELFAIDIDEETLKQSKLYATEKNLERHCRYLKKDAWNLEVHDSFDLISSSGLNFYVKEDEKVLELLQGFYKALKPGGTLITSFLTPPPAPGLETEWDLSQVDQKYALLQKILFADLIESKWQIFRSEKLFIKLMKKVGFNEIEVIYDKAHIFPTVIAKK